MKISKNYLLIVLSFISIYVIWGSTYLFNKIAVTVLPPFYLASVRFTSAGILIIIIAKILRYDFKITKKQFLNSLWASFFFLVYGNAVFVWALKYVDSGFGALLASTNPLFVLIIMRISDKKKLQRKSLIGIVLGMFGMFLLVSQKELLSSENMVLGICMMLSCVLSWSYGSVFVSKADLPKNYFVSTAYQMIIAGTMLAILSFVFQENWSNPIQWDFKVQAAMLFLIVFGGIAAFTAFNYLLKTVSPDKVATSAYVNPIIALFLGWLFLNETLTLQSIIASVVLLTGVYFITSRKRQ